MKWNDIDNTYKSLLETLKGKTPYEILEINEDSSLLEAKRSLRKKRKLYHPDRADDFMKKHYEEVIKILNVAFDSVKDKLND